MTARRFTDKPDLDPTTIRSLAPTHPAMVENRTLFPSTVVEVTKTAPDRIMVSGVNNRKLGDVVAKGAFKGYALYGLSLEERATCPADCSVRAFCYGNGTQYARRHRIGDPTVFFDRLEAEIIDLLSERDGLLVRLHVLGDFPNVEYVGFWADALDEHPKLAVYGYTHRRTTAWGGDDIGDAIQSVKDKYPDRFRIRWSSDVSRADGAVVIDHVPSRPRIDEGLVCPAQTDATACCASCGLCWEKGAKHDTIVFIKHGPKSAEEAAMAEREKARLWDKIAISPVLPTATRAIIPITLPPNLKPSTVLTDAPTVRVVAPGDLRVEPKYQRDLSGKSINLIRRIVAQFDWAKLKPPICVDTPDGLVVIDGQHTAIAAATHPGVKRIPVLIVKADVIEARADAFVAHNRDRVLLSPFQVFHAEVVAGNREAKMVAATIIRAGGSVPRSAAMKGYAEKGQVVALSEARSLYRKHGEEALFKVVRIGVLAGLKPITNHVMRGLRILLTEPRFAQVASRTPKVIAAVITTLPDLDARARVLAADTDQRIGRAVALLIEEAIATRKEAA